MCPFLFVFLIRTIFASQYGYITSLMKLALSSLSTSSDVTFWCSGMKFCFFCFTNRQVGSTFRDGTSPPDQDWTLGVPIEGLLYLLHRLPDIDCASLAVHDLALVGAACHTVSGIGNKGYIPPAPSTSLSDPLREYTYWQDSHRHTILDYRQYQRRVLDILTQGPHLRAALLGGGIIWRLVIECAEHHEGVLELLRSYLDLGPSEEHMYHQPVLQDADEHAYFDDLLTEAETDIISGVNKVYSESVYDLTSRYLSLT